MNGPYPMTAMRTKVENIVMKMRKGLQKKDRVIPSQNRISSNNLLIRYVEILYIGFTNDFFNLKTLRMMIKLVANVFND